GPGTRCGTVCPAMSVLQDEERNAVGVHARAPYRSYHEQAGRPDPTATPPLDTHGSDGTAGGHWDQATFGDELMIGYPSGLSRLSKVTIGALEDLGYIVDYTLADAYRLPTGDEVTPFSMRMLNLSGDAFR